MDSFELGMAKSELRHPFHQMTYKMIPTPFALFVTYAKTRDPRRKIYVVNSHRQEGGRGDWDSG
jgi:hypothetical protein